MEQIRKKRVAILHDTELMLDSRTQKEAISLIRGGYEILFCGWDKDCSGRNGKKTEIVNGVSITVENIRIKVQHQKGIKENLSRLVLYETKLIRWLIKNRKKYDYIHACNMDTALAAVLLKRLLKKKVVYDIFDDYADCHVGGKFVYDIIKWIDGRVIKKSNWVIICSEKRKQQLAKIPSKLEIIHNSPDVDGVDMDRYQVTKNNRLKIAYVGNLPNNRMIRELVDICSEENEIELYIGGAGLLEDYVKEQSGKYSNIHFLGRMSYEDVLSLEKQCDIIPAIYDPSLKNHKYAAPNKFYEAMALGKPTIMVNNTGMDEVVEREKTGLTINYTQDDLKKAILNIKDNIEYWRNDESRIRKVFKENYSWLIMQDRLLKIYGELL